MNTNLINLESVSNVAKVSGTSSSNQSRSQNSSNEENFEHAFNEAAQKTEARRPKQTTNQSSQADTETKPASDNATKDEAMPSASSTTNNNEEGKKVVPEGAEKGYLEVDGNEISENAALSGNELSLPKVNENLENQAGFTAEEILKFLAGSEISQLARSGNGLNGAETLLTSGNPEQLLMGNKEGNSTANAVASILNPGNSEFGKGMGSPLVQLLNTEETPSALGNNESSDESLLQLLNTEETSSTMGKNGLAQSLAMENPSEKGISPLEISNAKDLTENSSLSNFKGIEKPNSGLTPSLQNSNNENLSQSTLNAGLENKGGKAGDTAVRVNDDIPTTAKTTNKPASDASQKTQSQSTVLETSQAVKEADTGKNHNSPVLEKPLEKVIAKDAAQPAKVADGNQQTLNQSALNAFKPLGAAAPKLDLGTNVEIQSMLSHDKQASTGTMNLQSTESLNTSSALNAMRIADFNQTNPLEKMPTNMDVKPQEVLERSVVNQIVSKASLVSKNGQSEMHIQLDPPSLGTVKVQITMTGDKVSANLMADNSVAKDIIEKNIQQLRNSFAEQGFKVEEMSVNVGNDPRQQAADKERPFYMESGYNRDQSGMEENSKPEPLTVRNMEYGYSQSGEINLFI